jgi:1-deoxy-D-xylulose-5-phosphate reductoisomerase
MNNVVILGSTGSIGVNTLDVIRRDRGAFAVTGLAAGGNIDLLRRQIAEFAPGQVALAEPGRAEQLRQLIGGTTVVLEGEEGMTRLAADPEVDLVVVAVPGTAALLPALKALEVGTDLALASKEILVAAGDLAVAAAQKSGSRILPVDSEHSAIFQCLQGVKPEEVERIILTASGGPFLEATREELAVVTPKEALAHPRWRMGKKVSLDSATLMNKGLEVLEAHWLFGVSLDQIEVVIHPQSVIHSLVETRDGSLLAQLSLPDMRLPISYALYYPDRAPSSYRETVLTQLEAMTFRPPDRKLFPALDLAIRAGRLGGTLPAVLNAANEIAGEAFLAGKIPFLEIMEVVETVMDSHRVVAEPDLEAILVADRWARRKARAVIGNQ